MNKPIWRLACAVGIVEIMIFCSPEGRREHVTQVSEVQTYCSEVSSDETRTPLPVVCRRDSNKRKPTYQKVWATREGLVGETTATGHIIKSQDKFVALPSRCALDETVEVVYENKKIICKVLDVGPWSTGDPYWKEKKRPLAESGLRTPFKGEARNQAGIDLSDGLWDKLEIPRGVGIVRVSWRFVQEG